MSDELVKRLRMYKCGARDSVTGQIDSEAAADLIEQQAARIAELEAQIAAVAPAVDAQPVGVAGAMPGTDGFTMAVFKADDVPIGTALYASAQSEGLRKALTEIAEQEHIELMLDPTWAQRIAIAALSQHTGEKDD